MSRVNATVARQKQSSLSSAEAPRLPPLRKPHPACTITAIRAVAPAAEEVVVILNRPAMLSENHAVGVGYGLLFGCTTLTAAQWLLGSGLDNVFVGRLGELLHLQLLSLDPSVHPRGRCGILPYSTVLS